MTGAKGAGAPKLTPDCSTTLRTSEKPFECTPDEASPITTSPAAMSRRWQKRPAFGCADRKAGKVIVAVLVEARHLGGLAADQRAAGLAAAFGDAGHDRCRGVRIELAAGKIVEEEQRLGALDHEVVDRHGDEVDADAGMDAGFDRDLHLGADAVGGGHQDRVLEACRLQVEQAAEAADFGVGPRPRRGANHGLDQVDQPVAGVDVDARIGIGEAVLAVGHAVSCCQTGGYAGFRSRAMARTKLSTVLCKQSAGTDAFSWEGRPLRRVRDPRVSLPNLITLGRILLVPVIIWAITSGQMAVAFVLFFIAGVSDAVDGFLAKRFNMQSEIGALLDPLADKCLLVSIYIALGMTSEVPRWLVILVVSRDIIIIGAVIVSWLVDRPVPMKPLMVSKLNTVAQVVYAGLVLASLGFGFVFTPFDIILMAIVTVLTLLSVSFYLVEWVRHMNAFET